MHKTLLLLFAVYAAACLSEEMPPGLPFKPVDDAPATPPSLPPQPAAPAPAVAAPPETASALAAPPSAQAATSAEDGLSSPAAPEYEPPPPRRHKTRKVRHKAPKKRYSRDNAYSAIPFDDSFSRGAMSPPPASGQSVVIARGMLNRIQTPYANPKVLTVDALETKVDGNAIYVATESDLPVNLFISDVETGEATALQLTPQDLAAPVDIQIDPRKSANIEGTQDRQNSASQLFKQDAPYIAEIKAIMRALGKGQVPSGFSLSERNPALGDIGLCQSPGVSVSLGQVLTGDDADVLVFLASNTASSSLLFDESSCASDNTLAVAAWPSIRLAPGARTEVYVLVKKGGHLTEQAPRPSLLR